MKNWCVLKVSNYDLDWIKPRVFETRVSEENVKRIAAYYNNLTGADSEYYYVADTMEHGKAIVEA